MNKICFLLFCTVLPCFAAPLQWQNSKYTKLVEHEGKTYLEVSVPAGAPDAARANCATAELKWKNTPEGELDVAVKLNIDTLSKPRNYFHGAELKVFLKGADGKTFSIGTSVPGSGRTEKILRVRRLLPAGIQSGYLRLGLNDSTGTVHYDLSSLKVRFLPLNRQAAELTADQRRDFALICDRLRKNLFRQKAKAEDVEKLMKRLRADGSFDGVDYSSTNRSAWKTAAHLYFLELFCRAWGDPDSPYCRRETLAEAIRKSAGWWAEHRPMSSNFWWNDMEVPRLAIRAMLAAPELFPENSELRTGMLRVCHQAELSDHYTSTNRVTVARNVFQRSIIEQDFERMTEIAEIIKSEITESRLPEDFQYDWHFGGIRADRSFQLHGPQLQFGNYGLQFLDMIAEWATILYGTQLALNPEQTRLMRELAVDGYGWILWKGRMDLLAIGRQLGRNSAECCGARARRAIVALRKLDPEKAPYDAALDGNFSGAKYFADSNYLVYRRPAWFASLRMNSKRVRPVEDDVNGDNALGRYASDGTIQILRSGKESENVTGCWNWTRLPGTTLPATPVLGPEECKKRNLRVYNYKQVLRYSFGLPARLLGESDFVHAVAEEKHAATVYTQNVDGVRAKKAYFFDENSVYLLGAAIDSDSPYPVATTVNVARKNGNVIKGADWGWHDGIGYKGARLQIAEGVRNGDWGIVSGGLAKPAPFSAELFSVGVEHGIGVKGGSYAVAVLPGASPEETARFELRILANTPSLQAVQFADGTAGAVFHEAGKLGSFETKEPGVFLIPAESLK